MSSFSKSYLADLIHASSPSVALVKSSMICRNRPDIYQVTYNGTLVHNRLYCKKCGKVLVLSKGSTGNLSRHCKSHLQIGEGIDEHNLETNYHYPNLKQHIDLTKANESDILKESNEPNSITSETLRYWKENNMLATKPDLSIRRVIKVDLVDGILMAHVKWNDPAMLSSWIPARNLNRYHIYDTDITYEEDPNEELDSHLEKYSNLSKIQKRAIQRRKTVLHRKRHHL